MCQGVTPCTATLEELCSLLLATNKEAPDEKVDISADLHDIKIIKKEGRLKGKWL